MTEKRPELLLLSADSRLEHLLCAEARELCLTLRTERLTAPLTRMDPHTLRLILWDMDTVSLPAELALPAELPIYGLTSRQDVPVPTTPPLAKLWHRPLSVDALRTELLRVVSAGQLAPLSEEPQPTAIYFEADGTTLHVGESSFTLTEKEAAIMAQLLEHRGKAVTKEALRAAIAGKQPTDGSVSNKVEVYVCHLRRKLEQPLGLRLFSTVRGQGYCLLSGYEIGKDKL